MQNGMIRYFLRDEKYSGFKQKPRRKKRGSHEKNGKIAFGQ
jgi:hypothetical protein